MNDTVVIECPICGRRQTVEGWLYDFSTTDEGHPLTCGSESCPSHTVMRLVG